MPQRKHCKFSWAPLVSGPRSDGDNGAEDQEAGRAESKFRQLGIDSMLEEAQRPANRISTLKYGGYWALVICELVNWVGVL